MRYSQLFPHTTPKDSAKADQSVNYDLLSRAGFIDQLMAGSYTLLPLGLRVEQKIEQIVREEMNNTGAEEVRMPLMHPREVWDETGRWETASEVMYQLRSGERDFALSFTHEEIVLDVIRKRLRSYRDLPIKLYHFSTKFRRELRPRSGLLRGREFIMKDLYSAHASRTDLDEYYEEVVQAYMKAFKRMGLVAHRVEAGGGVFTDEHTDEFQLYTPSGEDTIFYCERCDFAQNREVFLGKAGEPCPRCAGTIKQTRGIEIGNIFKFGTDYSEKMKVTFSDESGKNKPVWFASYGIGATRLVGAIVEVSHDERGIIWPEPVAPYRVALVSLAGGAPEVQQAAEKVYREFLAEGVEVLYDDRDESAGRKFADADLIGLPWRVTVSKKTLASQSAELKSRSSEDSVLVSLSELPERLATPSSDRL